MALTYHYIIFNNGFDLVWPDNACLAVVFSQMLYMY